MNSYKTKNTKMQGAYAMFFTTLANNNRLRIINLLRKSGKLNVTDICKNTKLEQSLVSHGLKMLEYHGMVFVKREGKCRYYSVNEQTIKPLLDIIDAHMKQYCCKIIAGEI